MTGTELIDRCIALTKAKDYGTLSALLVTNSDEIVRLALFGQAAETAPVVGYIAVTSMGLHLNFEARTGDGAKKLIVRPSFADYTEAEPLHAGAEVAALRAKDANMQQDWDDLNTKLSDTEALLAAAVEALNGFDAWIGGVPHGDNCYVSDHYEGDPGNQCNCGRDGIIGAVAEAITKIEGARKK